MDYYIGIDIGGTKCAVVKGNGDGIKEKIRFETCGLEDSLEKIFKAVESLMPAKAIGVSCGGPLDDKRGIIMSPPNLPGWDDVHITDMLTERFAIPSYLCNDANACAIAEWKFGAGRGTRNMAFLTFGTGLGAGLILDGKLYSGTSGMAGEAGHIRLAEDGPVGYGKSGSFEGFCSGGGITRLARARALAAYESGAPLSYGMSSEEIENINTKSLAERAFSGDSDAISVFEESARRLGEGLAILVDILNPELIVIGSVYARCESLFLYKMTEVLRHECLSESLSVCRIVPAELGEKIGDFAALGVAMEGFENA